MKDAENVIGTYHVAYDYGDNILEDDSGCPFLLNERQALESIRAGFRVAAVKLVETDDDEEEEEEEKEAQK